jgi:hypothetical protein
MLGRFLFGRKLGLSCCFLLGLPGSGNSIICNKVILKAPLHLDSHLQDSFFLQLSSATGREEEKGTLQFFRTAARDNESKLITTQLT